jgi:hypothetical protein
MKIDFQFTHPVHGKFADAIHLPDDHTFSDGEIEAMKQQRFDNWVAIVGAPPVEENTTVEVGGNIYAKLEGAPENGAVLIQVEGVWYYRV